VSGVLGEGCGVGGKIVSNYNSGGRRWAQIRKESGIGEDGGVLKGVGGKEKS